MKPYTILMFLVMFLCTPALAEDAGPKHSDDDPIYERMQALADCFADANKKARKCDDQADHRDIDAWEACWDQRDRDVAACRKKFPPIKPQP